MLGPQNTPSSSVTLSYTDTLFWILQSSPTTTRLPTNTFWPSETPRPMRAPAQTCAKCQTRQPSPIAAPSSMMAEGCEKYVMAIRPISGGNPPEERVVITLQTDRFCIPDAGYRRDRSAIFLQTVAPSGQDFLVGPGVQVSEATGKLELLAIHGNRPKRTLPRKPLLGGQVPSVHRQEPAHPGMLVFKITRRPRFGAMMHDVELQVAEDEMEHVEEMHADVGGDAARLLQIAFPRAQVPMATRSDIRQVHFVAGFRVAFPHLLAQRHDGGMQAQLQDRAHAMAAFALDFPDAVDVPRIQNDGLFADDVAAGTQAETHVRVVQVVGRADGDEIETLLITGATQFIDMPIESLELGEKIGLRKIAVDDAHRIARIQRGNHLVASILDGFHVPWGNVTRGADQSEVLHRAFALQFKRSLNSSHDSTTGRLCSSLSLFPDRLLSSPTGSSRLKAIDDLPRSTPVAIGLDPFAEVIDRSKDRTSNQA